MLQGESAVSAGNGTERAEEAVWKPRNPTPKAVIPASVFQQVVEQADLAVSITDPKANILYVNPAFSRATGYAPGDVRRPQPVAAVAQGDAARGLPGPLAADRRRTSRGPAGWSTGARTAASTWPSW